MLLIRGLLFIIYLTVSYEATSEAFYQRFGPPEAGPAGHQSGDREGFMQCNHMCVAIQHPTEKGSPQWKGCNLLNFHSRLCHKVGALCLFAASLFRSDVGLQHTSETINLMIQRLHKQSGRVA